MQDQDLEVLHDIQGPTPLVLVADDEKDSRMLLRRILEREAFKVEEASDGGMVVEMAQELRPDLILLDVQMPGIDGFEAVKLLRQNDRTVDLPIIVVTAAAREPADVARGLGLGADDYLRKPFSTSELVARARSKIRAHRLEERLRQRTQELEALVRVGSELNQELALDELPDLILKATLDQLPASCAILALINADRQPTSWHSIGAEPANPQRFVAEDTLTGYVLANGENALIRDIGASADIHSIFGDTTCVSGIATPLKHRGEILGVIALGDAKTGRFSIEDLRLLRSIAEQAALAIRNAQLYTELQKYAEGLQSMVEARTAELQSAQAQLVRAEKLAALGTLAAGVAHEVNNPLQPLLTNLEMALEDLDANRPIDRELLEFAQEDVKRIQRIVMGLLDFARPGKAGVEIINIDETMREVLMLAGKQLEYSKVKVKTEFGTRHHIRGSADQLKQVFLNLVVNAMEAMPDGGQLHIRTTEHNNFIILTVRDTGIGIPPEELAQVFDPFFTTKADGSGLGLSVSYGIIEGHGGQVEVSSEQGKYTEFKIRLPIADE
jgi:two-component system NtrC family sensor kinase